MSSLKIGQSFIVRGKEKKIVAKYQAQWSMKLCSIPHTLFILWAGETKWEKFISDNTGDFLDLSPV